jgi:TRAP-type C4-dicarboxylate transport system substrate-binding protein
MIKNDLPHTRRAAVGLLTATAATLAMPALVRAQSPIVMKIGTPTLNDNQHEWMKAFAGIVEKRSGGQIKPELYPASQLGPAGRMIEGTQLGTIQVIVMPPEFLNGVDPRFEVLGAPGLFKDFGHAQRCLQASDFNKAFLSIGETKGLTGIGLFVNAQMIINCRTKLADIKDVANKKIRVLGSAMQTEQIRRLGGTGIPMSLGEVLPAVQQGTIDGVLGSLPVMAALRFYDAAKYILETNHATITVVSLASKTWLDGLKPELRTIVIEAGQQASRDIFDWSVSFNEAQREVWIKNGGEITPISASDREALIKIMQPIGIEVSSKRPAAKELFDLLKRTTESQA